VLFLVVAGLSLTLIASGLYRAGVWKLPAQQEAAQPASEEPPPPLPAQPAGDYVEPTEAERTEFARFFERYKIITDGPDKQAILTLIDGKQLALLAEHAGLFEGLASAKEPGFRQRVVEKMTEWRVKDLTMRNYLGKWTRTEIRRLRWSPDHKTVTVLTIHHLDEGRTPEKRQWWLISTPDGWKAYDSRRLFHDCRWSREMPSLSPRGQDPIQDKRRKAGASESQVGRFLTKDGTPVGFLSDWIVEGELPPVLDSIRTQLAALDFAAQGNIPDARQAYEQAAALDPDEILLPLVRARIEYADGQLEEAIRLAREFITFSGPDGACEMLIGTCYLRLKHPAEAADAFRRALAADPVCSEALNWLRRLLPVNQLGEVSDLMAKFGTPQSHIAWFLDYASREEDVAGYSAILTGYQKACPDDYRGYLWEFGVLLRSKLFTKADRLVVEALKKRPAHEHWQLIRGYANASIGADRVIEGYSAIPEEQSRIAFFAFAGRLGADLGFPHPSVPPQLGEELKPLYRVAPGPDQQRILSEYATDQLGLLIAAHKKRSPDDPLLRLYKAQLLIRAGKDEEAAALLADGLKLMEKAPAPGWMEHGDWDGLKTSILKLHGECLTRVGKK
jgi:tetratricopeptide (TPR) repeat protein